MGVEAAQEDVEEAAAEAEASDNISGWMSENKKKQSAPKKIPEFWNSGISQFWNQPILEFYRSRAESV